MMPDESGLTEFVQSRIHVEMIAIQRAVRMIYDEVVEAIHLYECAITQQGRPLP